MEPHPAADLVSRVCGRTVLSLTRREHDWGLLLDGETQIVIGCLWRLLEADRVRLTSQDDGQRFGLPAPVDAAGEATLRISGHRVSRAELRAGTLDLDDGAVFQIIPDSAGYEAWQICGPMGKVIATGGGGLRVFNHGGAR
jgi:hypothetical protein